MNILLNLKSRFRQTSFYKRLLISYIAGLLIVLLVVSFVSVGLIDTISDYSNQTALNATAQFQTTIESMVDSIQRLPTELSLDPTVVSLMNSQKPEFDARQRYSIIDLTRQLKSYQLLNPFIAGIFLYFPSQDYLISNQGVYTLNQWLRIYLQSSDLENLLAKEGSILWDTLNGSGMMGGKTVLCAKLPTESNNVQPVLCVLVNPILKGFSGAQRTDELSSFYTMNTDGTILFSGGSLDISGTDLAKKLITKPADQANGIVKLQDDYIGYTMFSDTHDFTYVYLSPESYFFSTLTISKNIVVFSCFLILVLGIILSIVFARKTSLPILRIANLIENNGKEHGITLEEIEQSVIRLVQTQKRANKDSEQYKKLHQESILLKLLHQDISNENALNVMLNENNVTIPGDIFLVVTITSVAEFPLEEIAKQFCSVFRSLIANSISTYFFHGADEIKLVVAGMNDSFTLSSIKNGFQQTIQYFESDRNIRLRIAISEIHTNLSQLGLAYEETQRVNEYCDFIDVNLVLTYGELLAAQSGNENNLIFDMWFNKFANTLMNQDFETARVIQKKIFNELSKREYSLQFIKCKIFSLIDRTINVIGELDIVYTTQLWDTMKLTDRLLECNTLTGLEVVYSEIFTQLTQIVQNTEHKETKKEQIISIIQNSYTDSVFGVATVANQLGCSSAYVSRVFKETFGCNMLDYIQKLRIDLAKNLLSTNLDMTMAQISVQCGFNNATTFTRVFKNYEGISPGKYRNQINN